MFVGLERSEDGDEFGVIDLFIIDCVPSVFLFELAVECRRVEVFAVAAAHAAGFAGVGPEHVSRSDRLDVESHLAPHEKSVSPDERGNTSFPSVR